MLDLVWHTSPLTSELLLLTTLGSYLKFLFHIKLPFERICPKMFGPKCKFLKYHQPSKMSVPIELWQHHGAKDAILLEHISNLRSLRRFGYENLAHKPSVHKFVKNTNALMNRLVKNPILNSQWRIASCIGLDYCGLFPRGIIENLSEIFSSNGICSMASTCWIWTSMVSSMWGSMQ